MPLEILIVDDDPVMLNLYSRIFCEQDYSITFAAGVVAAAVLIKANHYDLLITDLMLGDGLGTELTWLFAKKFPGAKSLLVTGSFVESSVMDLAAVTACLNKPLDIDKFIETVSKVLPPTPEGTACKCYAL